MLGTTATVLALASLCLGSTPTFAQPTNNDYYKSADTELLRNVEKYHLGLATDKLRSRAYESAAGDLGFILTYFPNHPRGLMLLIELCEQWKSPRCDLQERFENAIAVNPNIAATYVLQGIYLYRANRLPLAITSLEKAVELDPDSLNAHYNLGLVYFETKQFELANAHAQRAYQLGASVPGLRDKLKRAGQWKPVDAPKADPASPISSDSVASPAPRLVACDDGRTQRCSPFEAGRWRSDSLVDQVDVTLRMLLKRRNANRAGVRSHGVKRGNW